MKLSRLALAAALIVSLAAPAVAQTPAAAPAPAKPAATAPAPAATAPAAKPAQQRTAKSLDCSKQADAKNLHGKARKTFRDACKKG